MDSGGSRDGESGDAGWPGGCERVVFVDGDGAPVAGAGGGGPGSDCGTVTGPNRK